MSGYNKINVKLSDSQINKLKTVVKNRQGLTLRMNIKTFNGNNLPHELLLNTRQKNLRNAFGNNMSTDVKLSNAQISKIIQSGGFLGSLLSKIAGPLMKVVVRLAKKKLVPLGITAAASAIVSGIQNKIHGTGTTTLIITNEEMNDIDNSIVQALEDCNILLKGVNKTIENERKEQKGGSLGMVLGTLGVSLLGNMLTVKGMLRAVYGNKKGKGILRTGYGNKIDF